jgi:hypothetical protein
MAHFSGVWSIHLFIVFSLFGSIGLERDDSLNFSPFQQIKDTSVRITGFICQKVSYAPQKIGQQTASTNNLLFLAVTPTVSLRPGNKSLIRSHWSSRNA